MRKGRIGSAPSSTMTGDIKWEALGGEMPRIEIIFFLAQCVRWVMLSKVVAFIQLYRWIDLWKGNHKDKAPFALQKKRTRSKFSIMLWPLCFEDILQSG